MPRVSETVEIEAPLEHVWRAVHEDLGRVPEWAPNIRSVEVVGGGEPGEGSRLRYRVALPGGGSAELEVEQREVQRPRRCAGAVVDGPIRGEWSYRYTERRGVTTLTYEMDVRPAGTLRLAGGVITDRYRRNVRRQFEGLKRHVEGGLRAL